MLSNAAGGRINRRYPLHQLFLTRTYQYPPPIPHGLNAGYTSTAGLPAAPLAARLAGFTRSGKVPSRLSAPALTLTLWLKSRVTSRSKIGLAPALSR